MVVLASIEGHSLREVGLFLELPRGDGQIEFVFRPEETEGTVVMVDSDRASTNDVTLDHLLSAALGVEPAGVRGASAEPHRRGNDARLVAEVPK